MTDVNVHSVAATPLGSWMVRNGNVLDHPDPRLKPGARISGRYAAKSIPLVKGVMRSAILTPG